MARKILTNSINALRRADENIFMMPLAVRGPSKPKPVNIKATNLQPNTRYKVMLDNYPGNEFEDITDFCEPIGDSIKNNTHKVGRGRWIYFRSNADGVLELSVRAYGTDDASFNASGPTAGSDFTNLWKYGEVRTRSYDKGRDKIKFIAYTYVANPTSTTKIKSLKVDAASETLDTEGPLDPFGNKGSSTRPQRSLEDALPKGVICDCTLTPPGNPRRPAPVKANLYQTFYVSSATVRNDDTVDLLDVTLYFRRKPPIKSNDSGKYAPGVYVTILECDKKGVPVIAHRVSGASKRLDWYSIKVSSNATDGSIFTFARPITLKTNSYYAIAVIMEDSGYALWENIKGNYAIINGVKTEKISPGSSKGHQGQLFYYNGFAKNSKKSNGWEARPDLDIKFDTHMAEYSTADVELKLVNDDYEFFALSNTQPKWAPGEIVYKDGPLPARPGVVSIAAGSKKVTGNVNTNFGDLATGNKIVIIDSTDSTKRQVFTVDKTTINNNTVIYVDEFAKQTLSGTYKLTVIGYVDDYDYYFKSLRLAKSSVTRDGYNANNNMLFEVGDTIVGVETGTEGYIDAFEPQPMSVFRSDWNARLPAEFKPVTTYNLSYDDNGTYRLASTDRVFYLNAPNHVKDYEGLILSTSQEIVQTDTDMVNNDYKSAEINLTYQYKGANTKTYSAPSLRVGELNVITHNWYINNDGDNEHLNDGNAITRHISKTLELGSSKKAEDLRVILNAYRPLGTGIDVYAKIQNSQDSDAFEDKQWTKLVPIKGKNSFSDKEKQFDYKEMEFTFADYPEAATTLTGSFETNGNNNIIQGSGFSNTEIDALQSGDVIRVYSELFPNSNYTLLTVDAANSVSGEISFNGDVIANNSHIGDGFKIDTLRADEAAFRNPDNYNICRYFNSTGAIFDTYNKVAIKIVLLAESRKLVPKVDDYRVIAVSA